MQDPQKELVERLNQAQNILVTVSTDPSVDQLAAAIALTLALNHLGKHGTAVFSGQVPSTLEFLKPEDTLEKNTDSLRDFIIALDKSKADKLRYKVEDNVVRIFITPYKTSITDKDLDFSQGDFNVDVVIALGVQQQQQLDAAITAHGRILHDATVASINTVSDGELGTIHWVDTTVSSLSEMVVNLIDALDNKIMDSQIATALLTGIVATTERFRNDKTSPKTMSASAELMAAGANQQLIATQLDAPSSEVGEGTSATGSESTGATNSNADGEVAQGRKADPGTLEIEHPSSKKSEEEAPESAPNTEMEEAPAETPKPQVQVSEDGQLTTDDHQSLPSIGPVRGVSTDGSVTTESATEPLNNDTDHKRITEEPSRGGDITANSSNDADSLDPATDELTLPSQDQPMLSHSTPFVPAPGLEVTPPSTPNAAVPSSSSFDDTSLITPDETLVEIEKAVESPHVMSAEQPAEKLDDARSAVEAAFAAGAATAAESAQDPIAALHAQPLGPELHSPDLTEPQVLNLPVTNSGFSEPSPGNSPADESLDMPLPQAAFGTTANTNQFGVPNQASPFGPPPPAPSTFPGSMPGQGNDQKQDPNAPPPVPPPMLPPLQ